MKYKNTMIGLIILIFLTSMLLVPLAEGWRTQSGRGTSTDKSENKTYGAYWMNKATGWCKGYLDDKWNHGTGGGSYAKGHIADYLTTRSEYIKTIWGQEQAQINAFVGHGGKTTSSGHIATASGSVYGNHFRNAGSQPSVGNWAEGIPGSIYLFSTCWNGRTDKVADNARDGGGRYAGGFSDKVSPKFGAYYMKYWGKYMSHSNGYTIKQAHDKARTEAGKHWIYSQSKSTRKYCHPSSGSNACTLYHKPVKEYDFDGPVYSSHVTTHIVGGKNPNYSNDDGAFLFFNPKLNMDNAQIKIEYRKSTTSNWIYFNTYTLKQLSSMSYVNLDSQNLVIRFSDTQVNAGFLQVKITGLNGAKFVPVNTRVHIVSE